MHDAYTWDVSADGKRFLMLKEAASVKEASSTSAPATEETPRKINIIVNWFEELKQRVPVK